MYVLKDLTIPELRKIYEATQSDDVVEYTLHNFGYTGLYKLNLPLAIGIVNHLLEKDTLIINKELSLAKGEDLYSLLVLIQEVMLHIPEWNDTCEHIIEMIRTINLKHPGAKERQITRSFIASLLKLIEDENSKEESSCIFELEQVVEALAYNHHLTEEDVFGWLDSNPLVAKYYIINYKEIQEYLSQPTKENAYLYNSNNLPYSKLLGLLDGYRNILEKYKENSTNDISIEQELVNVMYDLITNLDNNDNLNVLTRTPMTDLFVESSYASTYFDIETNHEINRLFWNTWLIYNLPNIIDAQEIIEEEKNQQSFYPLMYQWSKEINNGTNLGLVYILFFDNVYKEDIYLSMDTELSFDDKAVLSARAELIQKGILKEEYFNKTSTEYVEKILPEMYPNIDIFIEKENRVSKLDVDETSVDSLLNAIN